VNELSALEHWAGALLARLSPAARRAARRGAGAAAGSKTRIAAQRNPDGTAYAPRKARVSPKRLRNKRGRIKCTIFAKLRTARLMRIEVSEYELAVGFVGCASRFTRVHPFGECGRVAPRGDRTTDTQRVGCSA
jgi:phage virion morphogenesis protein